MQKRLFGTDGIRGVANQYPMTSEVALALGRALAHVFRNGSRPRILIGKDTRLSGYMLETAIASGVCSMGGDVFLTGPMPTPGVAFLAQTMRVDAGVVISASHNLFQDNGIKIFDGRGFKLADETERSIERLILTGEIDHFRPQAEGIGKAWRVDDSKGRYIEFLKSTFPKDISLEGMRIVLDCAHGATYTTAPVVFEELGAEVTVIGAEPDGRNINDGMGAVFPQAMAAKVEETGADIGVALDGDGDRAVFADERGRVADGDAILAALAEELIESGRLNGRTMVASVMSNKGLDEYLERLGGRVLRCRVGDRYVVEAMRENGVSFGGESSGHILFLDYATTGDGIIAALQLMASLKRRRERLSERIAGFRAWPQVLQNVTVKERKDLSMFPEITMMIGEMERDLGVGGRLLVRYSGTEPVVRVMVEGREDRTIRKMACELASCIERNLS